MALETNIHALWGAKQTAQGTAATAPTATATTGKRLVIGAQGGMATNIEMGSEAFNDLDVYGDAQDYIQSIIGNGAPPLLGTPNELAWLCWAMNGGETVTPITGPPAVQEHVSVPTLVQNWFSFWQRVGSSLIERVRYVDCVFNGLEITAGVGQQVLRVTPNIISLDPYEVVAADPLLAMPAEDAFIWTEAEGALLLGGVAMTGPTQYTITITKNLEPNYADGVTPEDLQPGTPAITVTMAMLLKQEGFDFARNLIYATPTPAPAAKPARFLGGLSAFAVTHTQKDQAGVATGLSAKFEIPAVRWEKPSALTVPNPGGGGGTLELTGQMRKSGANPAWRSTIRTTNSTIGFVS